MPILAEHVVQGDLLHLKQGDQVVADGQIVSKTAEVDESLLTASLIRSARAPATSFGRAASAPRRLLLHRRPGWPGCLRTSAHGRSAGKIVHRASPLQLRFKRLLRVLLTATGVLGVALLISYNLEDKGLGESIRSATATITTVVPEGLLLGMTVAFAVGACGSPVRARSCRT